MHKSLPLFALLLALAACDLAPEISLPKVPTPPSFLEDDGADKASVAPATDGKWKRFDEKAQLEEFAWWRMFEDEALNALMEQAMKENPSLEVAINRVVAARSAIDTQAASLYPSVAIGAGPERSRQSPAAQEPNLPAGTPANVKPYTLYTARGTISYELDLFGQNRGRMRAAENEADAQQSDYRAARLGLQADVVQAYFRVAALRAELPLLTDALASREITLDLTRKKRDAGAADVMAVSSAEAELAAINSEIASVSQSLAAAEHALAILLGKAPTDVTFETRALVSAPPVIPAGLPSSLLERRPDIKRAEALIAAANERIGVARGGYFPDISLSAMGGIVSGDVGDLFKWSNRTWMIGPLAGTVLSQPLFEGGKLAAAEAQTQADFEGAVAEYKASVLNAFREVEDQLSNLRHISEQMDATQEGLDATTRLHEAATARFNVGYSNRLEFLDAERSLLAAKRSMVQLRANQYIATVQFVRALGGSWDLPLVPSN